MNPDLAFQVNPDPDPVPDLIQWIRIRINDQNLEKYRWKFFILEDQNFQITYP
jgi:hypothetical protein